MSGHTPAMPKDICQNAFVGGVSAWASCLPVVKTSADVPASPPLRELPLGSLLSSCSFSNLVVFSRLWFPWSRLVLFSSQIKKPPALVAYFQNCVLAVAFVLSG